MQLACAAGGCGAGQARRHDLAAMRRVARRCMRRRCCLVGAMVSRWFRHACRTGPRLRVRCTRSTAARHFPERRFDRMLRVERCRAISVGSGHGRRQSTARDWSELASRRPRASHLSSPTSSTREGCTSRGRYVKNAGQICGFVIFGILVNAPLVNLKRSVDPPADCPVRPPSRIGLPQRRFRRPVIPPDRAPSIPGCCQQCLRSSFIRRAVSGDSILPCLRVP